MENQELYKKEINDKILSVTFLSDSMELTFKSKKINISTHHNQDCCENVYGDFSIIEHYIEKLKNYDISNIIIKGVKDMGFLIVLNGNYHSSEKIFIPCYNSQNGYYSSDLQLDISISNNKTTINISDFVEDHVN